MGAEPGQACLVFVYNANAGIVAGIMDSIHKTLAPQSYACALCAVTHGIFRMNPGWRAWLKRLPIETRFFHRPDFRAAWPGHAGWRLPLVAIERNGALELLIDAAELGQIASAEGLAARLEDALARQGILRRQP